MSWSAVQNAILAYWQATTTVPEALQALDGLNGPAFDPPAIDPTSAETAAASIWCRLSVVTLPRTARPFGIGSPARRYYEGLIYRQVFIPRGFGEEIADELIEAEEALFHRKTVAELVRCRDCYAPERVPLQERDGQWWAVNVVNPFYVVDPALAED